MFVHVEKVHLYFKKCKILYSRQGKVCKDKIYASVSLHGVGLRAVEKSTYGACNLFSSRHAALFYSLRHFATKPLRILLAKIFAPSH